MKKHLLSVLFIALFSGISFGQITIAGPTFVKTYNPTWGNWVDDPGNSSGKIYVIPNYSGTNLVYEYSNMANLLSNTIAFTYTLPSNFAGTGHVVWNGNLYYNKTGTNNIVKYNLATQTQLLDVSLPNAGSMNTYHYQWGGYSDIDLAVDEVGLWAIYSTAANSGSVVISQLNPNTLVPMSTQTTSTKPKQQLGQTIMVQGMAYFIDSYSTQNTTISYKFDTGSGVTSTTNIPFSNPASSYLTSLVYNPSTKILFAWNNGGLYTYTVTPNMNILCSAPSNSYCPGANLVVSYTASGTFSAANTFSVELSNAAGSFGSPTTIGTVTSTTSGTIAATIPMTTPPGIGYRIRVVSSVPPVIGTNNGSDITIHPLPNISATASSTSVCLGNTVTLNANGASTYTWTGGVTNGVAFSPTATASYTCSGITSVGCTGGTTAVVGVTVNPLPSLTVTSTSTLLCSGQSATLTASGATTYSWTTGSNTSTTIVNPSSTATFTVAATLNGCNNTTSFTQSVSTCAGINSFSGINPEFKVFPNPNNGEFSLISGTDLSLEILNELGEVVKYVSLNANNEHKVQINGLSSGIYFVKTKGSDFHSSVKIIVTK